NLIRRISRDNPLWGAPRIHGELLKLGIDIAQSTVAKYMSRRHGPRSPGWQAFLRNHTAHIAGIDLFVVPTIGFKLLYGLVILRLDGGLGALLAGQVRSIGRERQMNGLSIAAPLTATSPRRKSVARCIIHGA